MLDRLLGLDEQSLAYDLSRAHSADIFFLKVRYWLWGVGSTVFFFLVGNIMGSLGIDLLGMAIDGLKELVGWD